MPVIDKILAGSFSLLVSPQDFSKLISLENKYFYVFFLFDSFQVEWAHLRN